MPRFKTMLNSHNFLLEIDGEIERLGFVTYRYVEAANEIEAERKVVEEFRISRKGRELSDGPKNVDGDPPTITIDEIERCSANDDFEGGVVPGLAFYPYDETDNE